MQVIFAHVCKSKKKMELDNFRTETEGFRVFQKTNPLKNVCIDYSTSEMDPQQVQNDRQKSSHPRFLDVFFFLFFIIPSREKNGAKNVRVQN